MQTALDKGLGASVITAPNILSTGGIATIPVDPGYPKDFKNKEAFDFPACNGKSLYEFPILGGGVYTGGAPGPFRVILTADFGARNGDFCGILYHPVSPHLHLIYHNYSSDGRWGDLHHLPLK